MEMFRKLKQANKYKCGHNKGTRCILFIWIWPIPVLILESWKHSDFAGCLHNSPLQTLLPISEISNKALLLNLGARTHISVTSSVKNPEKYESIYSHVFQASPQFKTKLTKMQTNNQ